MLSKAKKAPEGFTMAGEVNGLVICYKSAPIQADPKPLSSLVLPPLSVNLRPSTPSQDNPSHSSQYSPTKIPVRPAPLPPVYKATDSAAGGRTVIVSAATLSGFTGKLFLSF